jgi:hypothetical protein
MAPLRAPHAGMVPVGSRRRWERAPWQRERRCLTIISISWATLPGQNPKRAMESLELFARQVMPVVRAATGGEE